MSNHAISTKSADKANMKPKSRVRVANPCDGCTIRRVRCEAERPCMECRKRGIPCTTLRARQKRGPKGPRVETSSRILEFQRNYVATHGPHGSHRAEPLEDANHKSGVSIAEVDVTGEVSRSPASTTSSLLSSCSKWCGSLSLEMYGTFLELFRDRLQCIWPVIDYDELISRMATDEQDHESHAFAAAICAATIGQLRLPDHLGEQKRRLGQQFAQDSRSFRNGFDYMETMSVKSMLTSYLLHMHYVNAGKYKTAGFFMRETITYAQTMQLDRSETYDYMDAQESSLKLRAYWLILITERTYCAQNRVPVILPTIDKLPSSDVEAGPPRVTLEAFASLVSIFACLRANITEVATVPSEEVFDAARLARYQRDLAVDSTKSDFDEAQCVDILVTRQWVRLLIWEYTVRHFPLPYQQEDVPGFSLSFPVPVARELLQTLSTAQPDSIVLHGYGLELKVFRITDMLLDVMSISPLWQSHDTMLLGAEDIVQSLSNVLISVGGPASAFLMQTRRRLGELAVSRGSIMRPQLLPGEEIEEVEDDVVHSWQADAELFPRISEF